MAPMKRNRNRDRKNTSARRRGKNSSRKTYKYSGGSDGSRIKKRIAGHKLETTGGRNKNAKSRKMGSGRYSKMAKDGNRGTSNSNELRTKRYIRKALELGLSSGYLIPDESSDGQVLRVASDIVKLGRGVEEGSGSDEKPDDNVARGRGRAGRGGGCTTGGKRLVTKNGRTNLRKRGRSRTKSPKKSVAQKRRRKRGDSRAKVKARIQKRKRMPEAKNDEPKTRKNEDDPDDDNDDDDDEDDEPDTEDNGNKNSSDENKKLPIAGRPGTNVPDADNDPPVNAKKTNDEKEASGEEGSSEEEDDGVEEGEDQEQPDRSVAEEDANEDNEGQKADN